VFCMLNEERVPLKKSQPADCDVLHDPNVFWQSARRCKML